MTAVPEPSHDALRRVVIAVSGGPSDERIVRTACELARPTKAQLVAVHIVEVGWSLPLDADVAGRSEEAQRVLDIVEGVAEDNKMPIETVLLQARDVGAAIVDEASGAAPTCSSSGCPTRSGSAATSPSAGPSPTS